MTELEQKLADLQAKLDAASKAGESIEGLKAEIADLKKELESKNAQITALDASAKEQKGAMEALRASMEEKKPKTFFDAVKAAIEEVKSGVSKAVAEGKSRVNVEVKTDDPAAMGTGNVNPNIVLGVQTDPVVHAAPVMPNAAIAALGVASSEGNKLQWVEASRNEVVGYVEELASNTNLSDYSFAEKTRKYGKLVTKIELSTEFSDWFRVLYDWCINEARRAVENKFDYELFNGAGDDSTYPTKIYGMKGNATAFSAPYAVKFANIADVIKAAAHQIASNGFNANVAFVTYAEYGKLRALKDETGRYLFDDVTRMLDNIRVFPTTHLSADEVIVLDSSVYKPYAGNSYEIEGVRDADTDKWKFYFRKRAQAKFTTPGKLGMVYVSDIDTAIAALAEASAIDTIATNVAGLNADSKVFKTKEQE